MYSSYHRRKDQGLCPHCGEAPPIEGKSYCTSCSEKQKSYYKKLVDSPLCTICRTAEKVPGFRTCDPCRQSQRAKRKLAVEAGLCNICSVRPVIPGMSSCSTCRTKIKVDYRKLKVEAYAAYGGPVCACCGETEEMFLTIDHVHNDGNVHRRQLGVTGRGSGSNNLLKWLKKNNFPSGFQILCRSCNWGKHVNGGVCPHQTKRPVLTSDPAWWGPWL